MILASRNPHKLREFELILPDLELKELPEDLDSPEEDGETFIENALIKARSAFAATGEPVLADDSGLEVTALGGRPGVRSARFAGEGATDQANLKLLLSELEGTGGPRTARFVCAIALIDEAGGEHLFEDRCEGYLTTGPRGEDGFGYDPIFVPEDTGPEDQRTMAEISAGEKNAISHRGKAIGQLAAWLSARPDPA